MAAGDPDSFRGSAPWRGGKHPMIDTFGGGFPPQTCLRIDYQ